MKQTLLHPVKIGKIFLLKKRMTENSKYACWLLLSVILLTITVMGISGALNDRVRQMAEQTDFKRKEIILYREFAEDQSSVQRQEQQQDLLQKLREQVPEEINPEEETQRIYRLAGLHGITLQKFKRIPGDSAYSDKTGNRIGRVLWETELSGTWRDLIGFFSDIETRGPCTRIEMLQIRKSGEKGKAVVFSGTGRFTELFVSGRICMYYSARKAQRET